MWRKYLIYFLLLNVLNTSLFSAENLDDNPFDGIEEIGQEEINTVVEYVFEDVLGNTDETPEDEDDDSPDNLKFDKQTDACVNFTTELSFRSCLKKVIYSAFYLSKANTFALEVLSPPPQIV